MKLSITARLVAMFAAATLVTFVVIGAALYVVLQHELVQHQDQELSTNLQNMRYSIERVDTLDRWGRVQAKMDTLTPPDGRIRFWVMSDDPRFQYGKGMAAMQNMIRNDDGTGMIALPSVAAPIRIMSRDIEPLKDRPAVRLIVGSDSTPYLHTLHDFLIALVALSLATILAVMLIGYWIARVGLRPLKRLSLEARALRPKAQAQRLQASHLPVELADFAVAFNGAIGRLEDAYRQLEAFNADVAHELRTPLANLIGGTQVALSRPRSVGELEELLQSNLEELEELRLIINDMLFLARADQGEAATGLVRTPLAQEVRKTIDFYEVLLEELGASVEISGDVDAEAPIETALFRRALSNLLQNAIEHSAAGARITVEIRQGRDDVWVSVANPGEPIAEPHVRRLFDRFYRVDAARSLPGRPHGHGLGLAIVKAVASMHSGSVRASSAEGQTRIGFSVPLAGAAGADVQSRQQSEAHA
ncbi:MAG: heavy metal sensor histidine kinase [Pseudomonadota bacterium]|nr:heavy metal sensor histidine kinase [Pseudomonadota bacterium]